MKKIFLYLSLALAGSVVLSSCSKNDPPVFDDANAFVSFAKGTASIDESKLVDGAWTAIGDTVTLSVSLASVAGLEASVKFEVVPDTVKNADGSVKYIPKEGVNYEILTEGGVLKFDAKNRTREIKIAGKYYDQYTGDLKVNVVLRPTDPIHESAQSTCVLTIADVDHPLTPILGTYTMTATSYWYGVQNYTVTLLKDTKDITKVWINNLCKFDYIPGKTNAYGIVDDNMETIQIPFGQETEGKYSSGFGFFYYGLSTDFNYVDTGSMEVKIIKEDGVVKGLTFSPDFGFWVMTWIDQVGGNNANAAIILPGTMSAVKN